MSIIPSLGFLLSLTLIENKHKKKTEEPLYCTNIIDQFRYIKIQPKTIDLSTRLVGINTEFVGFIPKSLVLRSIVLG